MEFSEEDLTTLDIDWFSIDIKGHIGQFATGGMGFVPQSVVSSVENNDILLEFFFDLQENSKVQIIEENLPELKDKTEKENYLNSFAGFGSKGIFSFDVNSLSSNTESFYLMVVKPLNPLKINDLPQNIREILSLTQFSEGEFDKFKTIKKNFFY